MSHSGLYSGLYSRIREYGELLDGVILRIKAGKSTPDDAGRRKLAELLIAAGRGNAASLYSQVFAVLVQAHDEARSRDWSALGIALLDSNVESSIVDRLELLARSIEHEALGPPLEDAGARDVNDYLTGSIQQLISRARHLRAKIPRDLPREYDALAQTCHTKIQGHLDQLRGLLEGDDYLDPTNQPERFRAFRRVVSDLDILESSGIAALSRAVDDDHRLNQLVEKIRREIRYPLIAPVVTSLSQQYFCIDTEINLLFVPLTEGKFLLHLPDLYHELAHPLAQEADDPLVEPYQEALFGAVKVALTYIAGELTREGRRRGPEQPRFMLGRWRESWVKFWAEEFFCDLFAVNTLGPAYAWSHLHLTAKRGDDPFEVPVFQVASHPADDARMRALLSALEHSGFGNEAAAISTRWRELLAQTGTRPEPEYHRCYPDRLISEIVQLARVGTSAIACRLASPSTAGEVHELLNSAWSEFWRDPAGYVAWEENAISSLIA